MMKKAMKKVAPISKMGKPTFKKLGTSAARKITAPKLMPAKKKMPKRKMGY